MTANLNSIDSKDSVETNYILLEHVFNELVPRCISHYRPFRGIRKNCDRKVNIAYKHYVTTLDIKRVIST